MQSELESLYVGKYENNAVYRCPYDGCDAVLKLDEIERHIQEQCEAAYKNCANECGQSFHKALLFDHLKMCPNLEVICDRCMEVTGNPSQG